MPADPYVIIISEKKKKDNPLTGIMASYEMYLSR